MVGKLLIYQYADIAISAGSDVLKRDSAAIEVLSNRFEK